MYRQEIINQIEWKTDSIANTKQTIKSFFLGWNYKSVVNSTKNKNWEVLSDKDKKNTGEIKGFTNASY
jgi:hypothetical protein